MKHVMTLSKPAKADEVSPITLKNIIGPIGRISLLGDPELTTEQRNWLLDQLNYALSK